MSIQHRRGTPRTQTALLPASIEDYARALFAFQEARALWRGNERAKAGEIDARMAYAQAALKRSDFDLGISLLDPRHSDQGALRQQLIAAKEDRDARQARFMAFRRTAFGLAALIFLILSWGL